MDLIEYQTAVKYCLEHPTPGVDILLAAARRVLKDPAFEFAEGQRQQCKQAAYFLLYGGSAESFMKHLERKANHAP